MKVLYFECNMGAAGDMLTAALLELHPDPDGFIERLNNIGIPNVTIKTETVTKCGIKGRGMRVFVGEHEEGRDDHEHHHHHHHHTGMKEITEIIKNLDIPEKVKEDVRAVYTLIAEAESDAHGTDVSQIHFHEVGTMDAIADITGVCMLINELNPDKICSSTVNTGFGQVECAHGILPVPAPATEYILRTVPTKRGNVEGELCTPTGAALLKYFTDTFTDENKLRVEKTGYGMGKRCFHNSEGKEVLSAVRAMIGNTEDMADRIAMLSCNVDDMTGEQMGFAAEKLTDGGALDVYTSPVYMKKNRPGILLMVLCREEDRRRIAELMFKYTTTIGIREFLAGRYILSRSEERVNTQYGDVRVKRSEGYGVKKTKAEYEDLKEIALRENIPLSGIKLDY